MEITLLFFTAALLSMGTFTTFRNFYGLAFSMPSPRDNDIRLKGAPLQDCGLGIHDDTHRGHNWLGEVSLLQLFDLPPTLFVWSDGGSSRKSVGRFFQLFSSVESDHPTAADAWRGPAKALKLPGAEDLSDSFSPLEATDKVQQFEGFESWKEAALFVLSPSPAGRGPTTDPGSMIQPFLPRSLEIANDVEKNPGPKVSKNQALETISGSFQKSVQTSWNSNVLRNLSDR